MAEAQDYYLKAAKCNDQNLAIQFNLAKIYFGNASYNQAEICLEAIVKTPKYKDCFEAIRLLAQTKNLLRNYPAAVELYKRVIELNPRDMEATIEIAQIFETNDSKTALVYYDKALSMARIHVAEGNLPFIPPEILINMGTFSLEVGKNEDSLKAYEEALEIIERLLALKPEGEEKEKLIAMRFTAKFNKAYALEQLKETTKAVAIYNGIIEEDPSYLDAYLRLAYISRNTGHFEDALAHLEQAKVKA